MQNIAEEFVGEYLRWCMGCAFVGYNVPTRGQQGEMDVIGIMLGPAPTIYVCEVAAHLAGLQYNTSV
jgi:hypothetical protein